MQISENFFEGRIVFGLVLVEVLGCLRREGSHIVGSLAKSLAFLQSVTPCKDDKDFEI